MHRTCTIYHPFLEYKIFSYIFRRSYIVNCPVQVYIIISSLLAHFSLSRYCAILELISNFSALKPAADPAMLKMAASSQKQFSRARTSNLNCFSVVANLGSASLLVDLENGTEHSCILKLSLHELNFR